MKKTIKKMCVAVLVVATISFASCKKNENREPVLAVAAPANYTTDVWIGKFGISNGPLQFDIIAELKSDHTAKINESGSIGYGTWSKLGNVITANYVFNGNNEISFAGTIAADGKTMDGTWGKIKTVTGGGTLLMTKQ